VVPQRAGWLISDARLTFIFLYALARIICGRG
jgi:hypothetical protein